MDPCASCLDAFAETTKPRLEGLKTPVSVLWQVRKARTEGMGCNAAARPFETAQKTLLAWDRQCLDLHRVLLRSAVVHAVCASVIDGEEAETNVPQHVPPAQSPGGTRWRMDRASRCLWAGDGGKQERQLGTKALKTLAKMARQTPDLRRLTDGERRYGQLLCALCSALGHPGKPGRPKQTCHRGGHCRIKNKGAPGQKKGRKRPQ
jgi:hypothetical protein